jgi:penicillin amidase
MKLLKSILLGLIILIVITFLGSYLYLQSLKPDLNAKVSLPGLTSEVEVIYDDYGIPHIYAKNEEDLFYAFGYVHAQDRLFQMEILRRLADGRLSELFGEPALESDRFFRLLSFREHAKLTIAETYKDPSAPFVIAAKAYLKGINEYIDKGKTPVEFTLAGIPKTPFTLEDIEIIAGYMGYTFVGAFKTEAIATSIAGKLGNDYLEDIMSNWPDSGLKIPVQKNENKGLISPAEQLTAMANRISKINDHLPYPPFYGSNGWVISGSKTKSGKPILANDTHIAFAQPSVWYEAHLESPGFKIYGNFLAGTPVPVLGHSDKGGWGITMFENDDADFYHEKPNPQNAGQVWYKDHWEDLQTRKETITVKGKPDHILDVKKSRHGYILNGIMKDVKDYSDPIALWWVYYQFPSRHMQVFYNLSHAGDVHEASRAVEPLTAPGLNFMWADTAGNIGWWAAGKIPARPPQVNPQVILDGSSGDDDPTGWLDFRDNPQIINPSRGVLYTANNQPDDMGKGLVAGYYVPSNRADRIEELLFTEKSDWTEEESRKIINDVTTTSYARILKNILPVIDKSKLSTEAEDALNILMNWNGLHELDNIEPTIYYRFLYNIYENAFEDELGKESFKALESTISLKRNTMAFLQNDSSKWWNDLHTAGNESRSDILTKSLNEAMVQIHKDLGENKSGWTWKNVHSITHKHPMGILPLVGRFFNVGPIPVNGGRETINNLNFNMDSSGRYPVVYGPALRRIIDFGNPDLGYSVNPTGQSGYFMSSHYDDQARLYAEGGKRPELMDRKSIEKASTGKTKFTPKK